MNKENCALKLVDEIIPQIYKYSQQSKIPKELCKYVYVDVNATLNSGAHSQSYLIVRTFRSVNTSPTTA